jgi:NADPH-dependent glutamate synthase beta subunit-like oxidoreductase
MALSAARGPARQPKDFHWLDLNIPCQAACPARTDIPGYLEAVAQGDFAQAYLINLRDNVFPAVLGRVCTRPCEPACRHGWKGLGEPVAICFSKRSAADFQSRREPVVLDHIFPPSGRRVAVVGAGAAGLAAARELALWGHTVTVYEQHAQPGGMMVQGIPGFRLPRDLVALEIEQIRRLGVEIRCGVAVGRDVLLADLAAGHDAVILAAGTMKPTLPDLPGVDAAGVRHGLEFLRAVHAGGPVAVGRRVVVIGGGFTAVDCARTARRLGASSVGMYYRRTAAEMYITPGEVEEMAHEGIAFETQVSPVAIGVEGGRVTGVRFVRTEPGPAGPDGRRGFRPVPDSAFEVAADTVLLGTGQVADTSWMEQALPGLAVAHGRPVLSGFRTGHAGVFVAGDYGAGARSLIDAIADGKGCAREIDRALMGEDRFVEVAVIADAEATGRTRELDALPRQSMPVRPAAGRDLQAEVETGFDPETARTEAKRCYLCHFKYEIDNELCIYCDRCLKVKPVENCIVKVSSLIHDEAGRITGYHRSTGARDYHLLYIDQSQCIRCGACKDVCPVECIDLQRVSRQTVCASSLAGKGT